MLWCHWKLQVIQQNMKQAVTFYVQHYCDIMGWMASQITSLTIVYSTIRSGTDQRKHQSSASLAFVRGIHRWSVNSADKWTVMGKMFPFDDVIMKMNDLNTSLLMGEGLVLWKKTEMLNTLISFENFLCLIKTWSFFSKMLTKDTPYHGRCRHSWAVATLAKYKRDIQELMFVLTMVENGKK